MEFIEYGNMTRKIPTLYAHEYSKIIAYEGKHSQKIRWKK